MKNGIFALLLAALALALTAGSAFADPPDSDRDGDGVPWIDDICPGMAGAPTFYGCVPQDRDHDGIRDDVDPCPFTAGTTCAGIEDVDADTVPDAMDACVPLKGIRPLQGCPTPGDDDMDGIPNLEDPCPFTAAPTCDPPSDTDGDGVADRFDACPYTKGSPGSGCPTPGDDDMDGIPNREDPCPFTVSTVCDPPPDTDGDGVADAFDACPTLSGPTRQGCPLPQGTNADDDAWLDFEDDCPTTYAAPREGVRGCPPGATPEPKPENKPAPKPVVVKVGADSAGTRLRGLAAYNVPEGATITVRCTGRRCPSALRKGARRTGAKGTVKLDSLVKRRLAAGTVLTISVSKPGVKRSTTTVKIRKGKKPLVKTV
jgi:hypothetical protein